MYQRKQFYILILNSKNYKKSINYNKLFAFKITNSYFKINII